MSRELWVGDLLHGPALLPTSPLILANFLPSLGLRPQCLHMENRSSEPVGLEEPFRVSEALTESHCPPLLRGYSLSDLRTGSWWGGAVGKG